MHCTLCIHIDAKYEIFLSTGTVLFNSKYGCQKCSTVGEYIKDSHRMCFTKLDAPRRTNETFRNRDHPEHHKEKSPFEVLFIDMIASFPTSDPLHLLELGVMRKCLYRWVFGEKSYLRKWSKALIDLVSRLLRQCENDMPVDMHRAVRGLDSLKHWKGLEYRTMLLYVGCVVFKQVITIFFNRVRPISLLYILPFKRCCLTTNSTIF